MLGEVYHTISWKNYLQFKNVVLVSSLVKEYYSTMLNIIKLVQDQGLNPNIKNNKLPATEQNFLFKSCKIWNTFAKNIFEKNKININRGYIIHREEANSDLQLQCQL